MVRQIPRRKTLLFVVLKCHRESFADGGLHYSLSAKFQKLSLQMSMKTRSGVRSFVRSLADSSKWRNFPSQFALCNADIYIPVAFTHSAYIFIRLIFKPPNLREAPADRSRDTGTALFSFLRQLLCRLSISVSIRHRRDRPKNHEGQRALNSTNGTGSVHDRERTYFSVFMSARKKI